MQKNNKIVVKVGTKVLTSKDRALDKERVRDLARQIAGLKKAGIEVILVTSGAIGAGLWLMGLKKRPTQLARLQAAAAIGQNRLMNLYAEYLKEEGYLTGQVLLTQEDFNDRSRYLNIKHTIDALLKHSAVPVINENDTVATDEIKCGDNDRLSSLVADLCQAQKLILLTDVDGLLDENGLVIKSLSETSHKALKLGSRSRCDLGTGGIQSKLEAARAAANAGIDCVIANGRTRDILRRIVIDGEPLGTAYESGKRSLAARKRWIAFSSKPKGIIYVDDGAREAVSEKNKSLLASGILDVVGDFSEGDVVSIIDKRGQVFARGISNYSSRDAAKIRGLKTSEYKDALGHKGRDEVVHKDNLAIL